MPARARLAALLALAGAIAGVAANAVEFDEAWLAGALSVVWVMAFGGGVLALRRPERANVSVTLGSFPAALQAALLLFALFPLPAAPFALNAIAMLLVRRRREEEGATDWPGDRSVP